MVINDDFTHKSKPKNDKSYQFVNNIFAASFLDRLAAFIIDYIIIISPIATLFISPFKKQLSLSGLVYGEINSQVIYLNIAIVLFSLSFLYNLLFTYFFRSTLGQMFMGLKIGSVIQNHQISLFESFVRSFFYNLSLLMLGVPFIFIWTHRGRRSLHDLVSDTFVYSTKQRRKTIVSPVLISRFSVSLVSVGLVVAALSLFQSLLGFTSISEFDSDVELCEDVNKAMASWPEQTEVQPERLSVAMALFAIEEVSKDCLQKEATYVFDSGEETGLAYLANAFIYAEEPRLSDKYLGKVCELEKDSETCKMAKVIDYWATDSLEKVNKVLDSIDSDSVYVNLWKSRFLMNEGFYKKSFEVISKLPKLKVLSHYSSINKVKLFWYNRKFEQAKIVSDMIYEKENTHYSEELASWLCYEELERDCGEVASTSCQLINTSLNDENRYADISMLKQLECSGQLSSFHKYNWQPEVFSLINLKLNKKGSDLSKVSHFLSNEFDDPRVPYAAVTTFLAKNPKINKATLEKMMKWTREVPEAFNQSKLAAKILSYLVKIKNYSYAFYYGEKFVNKNSSLGFQKNLVVSAYYMRRELKAKFYLDMINIESSGLRRQRSIASENEFSRIKKLLEGRRK